MVGDACDPKLFEGRRFDFVHSNSVIEHVGDDEQIRRFARNTRRLGDRYYMQTPDYWFPYEPHFRFPGFPMAAGLRARLHDDQDAAWLLRPPGELSRKPRNMLIPSGF